MVEDRNIAGERFGNLVAIERMEKRKKGAEIWKFRCDCGKEIVITRWKVMSGHKKSCGCLHPIHNGRGTRLYGIWKKMKYRCYGVNCKEYAYYGGRGIKLCREWEQDFPAFRKWAYENGYSDSLTIDRIDPNGDYSPENCRWVGMKEQNNNKRSNVIFTINRETKTLSEWADYYGMPYKLVHERVSKGEDILVALTKKKREPEKIQINGEWKTFSEWSKISGVDESTITYRFRHGLSAEESVFMPPRQRRKL